MFNNKKTFDYFLQKQFEIQNYSNYISPLLSSLIFYYNFFVIKIPILLDSRANALSRPDNSVKRELNGAYDIENMIIHELYKV